MGKDKKDKFDADKLAWISRVGQIAREIITEKIFISCSKQIDELVDFAKDEFGKIYKPEYSRNETFYLPSYEEIEKSIMESHKYLEYRLTIFRDSWHWQLYDLCYDDYPATFCEYFWKLAWIPIRVLSYVCLFIIFAICYIGLTAWRVIATPISTIILFLFAGEVPVKFDVDTVTDQFYDSTGYSFFEYGKKIGLNVGKYHIKPWILLIPILLIVYIVSIGNVLVFAGAFGILFILAILIGLIFTFLAKTVSGTSIKSNMSLLKRKTCKRIYLQ